MDMYYIDKTKALRKSRQLFISYVFIILLVLRLLRDGLKKFCTMRELIHPFLKLNSLREASAVFSRGCSLNDILRTGEKFQTLLFATE